MILTTHDKGMIVGERKALREMLIELASSECGVADDATRTKFSEIEDVARLRRLVVAAPKAQS